MTRGLREGSAARLVRPLIVDDYPMREYLASMTAELAGMARRDGDVRLAALLDVAAEVARTAPKDLGVIDPA